MIVNLISKFRLLRNASGIVLMMLIGCKVVLPTIINLKAATKVMLFTSEQSDNDGEKKTETFSPFEKEKEFFGTFSVTNIHNISYTIISHITAYTNNYHSSHFLKISTPPPDFYLQSAV